ncbi:hypothetical protein [Streptomyces sp. NPDC058424]
MSRQGVAVVLVWLLFWTSMVAAAHTAIDLPELLVYWALQHVGVVE